MAASRTRQNNQRSSQRYSQTDSRSRERGKRRKKAKIPPLIVVVFLIMTAAFLFNAVKFYMQKVSLKNEKQKIIEAITEQEELKQLYMEELSKVGTNEYYEYLARKHLGYIYPDEKVLIIVEP